MKDKRILFGICGSFCNHEAVYNEVCKLCVDNDVQIVVSDAVYTYSTRFFDKDVFRKMLETKTGHKVIHNIVGAEKVGPSNVYDIMVIAPMTANVASKLANGIYDHPVTLTAKALLRNKKNILFGFASNDGLSISGVNVMRLLSYKHFYAIPFRQDAPFQKECSIVADWTLLLPSLEQALLNSQIQPVLLGGIEDA